MKAIYIAGPFRGETPWDVERNVHAAECVALEVARHGAVPVCPHTSWRHFDKALPDSFWLRACGDLLRKCDAMVRLAGWQDSVGTCAESALASELGMRVIDWESPTASLELATWLGEV